MNEGETNKRKMTAREANSEIRDLEEGGLIGENSTFSKSTTLSTNPEVPSGKRRKHTAITISQKQGVLDLIDEGKTYEEISNIYGIAQSTISNIKEHRQQIIEATQNPSILPSHNTKLLKSRLSKGAQIIDERLCNWILKAQERNVAITGPKIVEKARLIADKFNLKFKGSNGWLESFKRRHNISFKVFRRPSQNGGTLTINDNSMEEEDALSRTKGKNEDGLSDWESKILLAEVDSSILGSEDTSDSEVDDEEEQPDSGELKRLVSDVIDLAAQRTTSDATVSSTTKVKDTTTLARFYLPITAIPSNIDPEMQKACQGLLDFANYCDRQPDVAKFLGVSQPVKQLLRSILAETNKLPSKSK